MEQRSNFNGMAVGDRISETQYYEIKELVRMDGGRGARVQNERGFEFTISARIIEEGMYSANQHVLEEKVTRTEMVEVLENAGDTIFTVNFNKQVDAKAVLERLKASKVATTIKAAKMLLEGNERTLVGYLLSTEPKMGRSQVIDLEIDPSKHRIRLVDHRTLNWIIIRNVKYILK